MRPGNDPFGALSRELDDPKVFGPQEDRSETLRRSSRGLVEGVRENLNPGESLLLVVDQFEELFTFRRKARAASADDQTDAFVQMLMASSEQDEIPVYVVLTMRSDFLGDCAVFHGFPETLNGAQYLVPVLTRRQLRPVIEEPVRSAGVGIAPELVERVLNDVGHGLEQELDQLPVLQHALMRSWGDAEGAPAIKLEHYRQAGGMSGALNQHAQQLYEQLSEEEQGIAKRVFQRLTEKEFEGRDIRNPTSFGQLREVTGASAEQLFRVVEHFRDFLTSPDRPPYTDSSMIDIAHEALIRQWKDLRKWADEEAHSADVYQRLDYDASRAKARPWEDPDLAEALELQEKSAWNLTWAQRYTPKEQAYRQVEKFLERSRRHRTRKRVQWAAVILVALAIPALVILYLAEEARQAAVSAEQQAELARQQAELANSNAELEQVRARSD
ncbi:MAG: hypothetical protein GY953_58445, partial [bacterium]|nr:hypothetical protein [bacterium]